MEDFTEARLNMIEGQVRTNDVSDQAVQKAMSELPRERFVPREMQSLAHSDDMVEVAEGRFMTRPRAVSKLMQAADVRRGAYVLHGTGMPSLILIASGSEVELAMAAATLLERIGLSIVMNDKAALQGAASYASRRARGEHG